MVTHLENQILAKAAIPGSGKCHISRRNSQLKTGKRDRDLDQILIEGPRQGRWKRSQIPKKNRVGNLKNAALCYLIVGVFSPGRRCAL